MYQTPGQLGDLENEAASGAIHLRAQTSWADSLWQYRLYLVGPDSPSAGLDAAGRHVLVRVNEDDTVHEIASPRQLAHTEWAEDLFDRLTEAQQFGGLPSVAMADDDGTEPLLLAAERQLTAAVLSAPPRFLDVELLDSVPSPPANRPADDIAVSPDDLRAGDLIEHLADRPEYLPSSDDTIPAIVVSVTGRDLTVQDIDGDDEPYDIDLNQVVSASRPAPTIPVDAPRFRPLSQDDLAPSGPLARIRANIAAIRVLHQLREDDRPATEAEQAVLARWSSWGAVPAVFDPRQKDFAGLRAELRSLLTEEEWNAAEATTRNAHFTDAALVQPIWNALKALGVPAAPNGKKLRFAEPGCGSGNFIAFVPEGVHMTGIELDPVTAAIAAALYPDAEIRSESFVDTRMPDGYFDGAVGNVPFDEIALHDPNHNPLRLATHNHFIVKSLDLVRPGGLVAVLTSRYTLDSIGKTARLEISNRADLVGAVRLPAGAHRKAAGTEAVTDLLILRRRDEPPEVPPDWIGLAHVPVDADTGVLVNSYFAKHPEMVLGRHALTSGRFSAQEVTIRPHPGADTADALTKALAAITTQARESGLTMSASPDARQRAAVEAQAQRMHRAQEMFGDDIQRFQGTLIDQGDGTFLQLVGHEITERSVYKNAAEELRSLLRLRDTYVELLSAESTGDTEQAATLRSQLNYRYDIHTSAYGAINKREARRDRRTAHGAFRTDPYAAGVYALEIYDPDTETASKDAIFTRAVTKPEIERTTADTPQDALAISLNTFGQVRLSEIARLLTLDSLEQARDALGDLVYNEPGTQRLIHAPTYLSGNVREKLEAAQNILHMVPDDLRDHHPLQANVTALRKVLPPDKQPGDIDDIRIGATWIDPKFYQDFLQQLLQTKYLTVTRESGADWDVDAPKAVRESRAATKVYGTEKRDAVDLFERMLCRSSLVVHPPKSKEDTSPEEIRNGKIWAAGQTEQVVAKADELDRLFGDWLWQDPDRTREVLANYNRLFNSRVPYQGDGSHLTFPGISDAMPPRPHQRAGVARALVETGGAFFDYEVGFGKTLTIAMTLMEMRRLGTVKKPCVVVKNATVNGFRNDFLKAYPKARVLAIDSADFDKDTAATYIAQIANGDWDVVILPQSLFKRIPLSGLGQQQYIADQTADYRARIHKVITGSDAALDPTLNPGGDPLTADALDTVAAHATEGTRPDATVRDTVKKLQGDLKRHTQRAQRVLTKTSITGISFEQTGINFIAVDEVQDYANGDVGANNSELALTVSGQARDLKTKLRALARAHGPKVGLGSTGTPFPNAMSQAFVMIDLFRPDLLAQAELGAFSSFQAQYLRETMAPEVSPEGTPRIKERIGAFMNAKQFHQLWKLVADVKTARDVNLPRPDSTNETIVVPATDADRDFMDEIAIRAEEVRAGNVEPSEDNLLKISNDGRMAAMDLRMVGREPDGPGKLDAAAERIAVIYREHKDRRYTNRQGDPSPLPGALQLVFADRGTASDDNRKLGKFIAYDYLRDELIRRGVPANRIHYAQEAKTAEEKEQLFADARNGKVSVLIGSTETMGVGVNVQDRAIALHHIDCPWRPSDVTQREGRIVRQFNQHFGLGIPVRVYRWVKEGSFDAFMWQTVERKARFTDQIRTGRELEEQDQTPLDGDLGKDYLEFREIKAIASGNPLLLKKMHADEELRQLESAYSSWKRTNNHLRNVVDTADATVAAAEKRAALVGRAAAVRTDTTGTAFNLTTPDGTVHTKRTDAATALRTQLALIQRHSRGARNSRFERVATLGGQDIQARIDNFHGHIQFTIEGLSHIAQATFAIDDASAFLSDPKPPLGLIARLENHIEKLDGLHSIHLAVVDELKLEIERATKLVDQPFSKHDKLLRARANQAQIDAEIDGQAGQMHYDDDQPHTAAKVSSATGPDSVRDSARELRDAYFDWYRANGYGTRDVAREEHEPAETTPEDAAFRLLLGVGNEWAAENKRHLEEARAGGQPDFRAAAQTQALVNAAAAYLDIFQTLPDTTDVDPDGLVRELVYAARNHLSAAPAPVTAVKPAAPEPKAPRFPRSRLPGQDPARPYADRDEYWAAEQAMLDTCRSWVDQFGSRLADGSPQEQALAQAGQRVMAESARARRARLLHLPGLLDVQFLRDLTDKARSVGDQWEREARETRHVSATWNMLKAVRKHADRYLETIDNPQTEAAWAWLDTPEPTNTVADAPTVPDLTGFTHYTVTGEDGVRGEPADGTALQGTLYQLVAEGATLMERPHGLTLTWPDGTRYDIAPTSPSLPAAPDRSPAAPAPASGPETDDAIPTPPTVDDTIGSALPRVRNLAALLGHYSDAGEAVAGRELVRASADELRTSIALASSDGLAPETAATLADTAAAIDAAATSDQHHPNNVFTAYDTLAQAAERLADSDIPATTDPAQRLAERTHRHLARLHATRDLYDLLLDAANLDPESWAVQARTDPLKERPTPYTDSSHLHYARSIVFETYDRWPDAHTPDGSPATQRLRTAVWDLRQTPDTLLGRAITEWLEVAGLALEAASDADQPASREVLRNVARHAYEHQRSLAAHQLAAANADPYGPDEPFEQGTRDLTAALEAWAVTATAKRLALGSNDPAAGGPTAAKAQESLREAAHQALWATAADGTLDDLVRQSTNLAHASYAMALSLPETAYRNRDDRKVLAHLIRAAYGYAASTRTSRQDPAAAAEILAALTARDGVPASSPAAVTTADTGPQAAPTAVPAVAVIEIEHHYLTSTVRGVSDSEADAAVRTALERQGFKPTTTPGAWALPSRTNFSNRNSRVCNITFALQNLQRSVRTSTDPPELPRDSDITIPDGQPYTSKQEATQDFDEMFGGLWRLKETPAGKKLLTIGLGARPDGEAVRKAVEDLRQGPVGSSLDPFVHPAQAVAERCRQLATAAIQLSRNLEREQYRAPVALPHLRTLTQYATLLASRITATAEREGAWERAFTDPAPDTDQEQTSSGLAEPAVAEPGQATSTAGITADPLVAGPYSGEGLLQAAARLAELHQQLSEILPRHARALQGRDDAVAEFHANWEQAHREATTDKPNHPTVMDAYQRALGSTTQFAQQLATTPEDETASVLAQQLLRETESHIVRLTLTIRQTQEDQQRREDRRTRGRAASQHGNTAAEPTDRPTPTPVDGGDEGQSSARTATVDGSRQRASADLTRTSMVTALRAAGVKVEIVNRPDNNTIAYRVDDEEMSLAQAGAIFLNTAKPVPGRPGFVTAPYSGDLYSVRDVLTLPDYTPVARLVYSRYLQPGWQVKIDGEQIGEVHTDIDQAAREAVDHAERQRTPDTATDGQQGAAFLPDRWYTYTSANGTVNDESGRILGELVASIPGIKVTLTAEGHVLASGPAGEVMSTLLPDALPAALAGLEDEARSLLEEAVRHFNGTTGDLDLPSRLDSWLTERAAAGPFATVLTSPEDLQAFRLAMRHYFHDAMTTIAAAQSNPAQPSAPAPPGPAARATTSAAPGPNSEVDDGATPQAGSDDRSPEPDQDAPDRLPITELDDAVLTPTAAAPAGGFADSPGMLPEARDTAPEASDQPPNRKPLAADAAPTVPDGATAVPGHPGYWWRYDPEQAHDPYADYQPARLSSITIGFGERVIGHATAPDSGGILWMGSVNGSRNSVRGKRTPGATAAKIAQRHLTMSADVDFNQPRPAETVWIDHTGRTAELHGVPDKGDDEAQAAREDTQFTWAPSRRLHVQTSNTSRSTSLYKTSLFVTAMLERGRTVAVRQDPDTPPGPADTTAPELWPEQRQTLHSTDMAQRKARWSPIDLKVGDEILAGSTPWWRRVTAVNSDDIHTFSNEPDTYANLWAVRRDGQILTIADAPDTDRSTARPLTGAVADLTDEQIHDELAQLDLPLAEPGHAVYVAARKAVLAASVERRRTVRREKERQRAERSSHQRTPAGRKNLVLDEDAAAVGATAKDGKVFLSLDRDGNPWSRHKTRQGAREAAYERADRAADQAPAGWRPTAFDDLEPGEVVRLPFRLPSGEDDRAIRWSQPLTLVSITRSDTGEITIEGSRGDQAVTETVPGPLGRHGAMRPAEGRYAYSAEQVARRAARAYLRPRQSARATFVITTRMTALVGAASAAVGAALERPLGSPEMAERLDAVAAAATAVVGAAQSVGDTDLTDAYTELATGAATWAGHVRDPLQAAATAPHALDEAVAAPVASTPQAPTSADSVPLAGRFATTGQLITHFKAAPMDWLASDPHALRDLRRLADRDSFSLTPNGQFALFQEMDGTWALLAAGSGLEVGRVDEYACLTGSGLDRAMDVMRGLRTHEEALAFSERLAALRDHLGEPVGWDDPALPRTLGAYRHELDRLVLGQRASLDQAAGREATSTAYLVWDLINPRPDRPQLRDGEVYPDALQLGDRVWFDADDAHLPHEVLAVRESGPAGLITLTIAPLSVSGEDGTFASDTDQAQDWDLPTNLPLTRTTEQDLQAEAGYLPRLPTRQTERTADEDRNAAPPTAVGATTPTDANRHAAAQSEAPAKALDTTENPKGAPDPGPDPTTADHLTASVAELPPDPSPGADSSTPATPLKELIDGSGDQVPIGRITPVRTEPESAPPADEALLTPVEGLPGFSIRTTTRTDGDHHELVTPDGEIAATLRRTLSNSWQATVGQDVTDTTVSLQEVARRAARLWAFDNGINLGPDPDQPYTTSQDLPEGRQRLGSQRTPLIEAGNRAFGFDYAHQPELLALEAAFAAWDDATGNTVEGMRAEADTLSAFLGPAAALRDRITGEARELLAFPTALILQEAKAHESRLRATADFLERRNHEWTTADAARFPEPGYVELAKAQVTFGARDADGWTPVTQGAVLLGFVHRAGEGEWLARLTDGTPLQGPPFFRRSGAAAALHAALNEPTALVPGPTDGALLQDQQGTVGAGVTTADASADRSLSALEKTGTSQPLEPTTTLPAVEPQQPTAAVDPEPEPDPDAWTNRIQIVSAGRATYVTGTGQSGFYEAEAGLRELLKKNRNFGYIKDESRWRYKVAAATFRVS
uniref:helicase-related protein n=1 Tax=Kitasatospora sp. NBC_01519 TaxID=2903576 RepID=UPI002F91A5CA